MTATYTLDKWNRQIQYALSNLILSINFLVFPFLTSLTLYLINQAVNGVIVPIMNTIPNVWVMEMFEMNRAKTYLQIMHIFFPIGQMLGPLIYVPFINQDNSTAGIGDLTVSNQNGSFFDQLFETLFGTARHSNLWIPYLIVSLFKVSVSVLVMVAYIIKVSSQNYDFQ